MEQQKPQYKMGILSVGRNDFEESVYQNRCPSCGVPAFYWCQTESGKRLGTPHGERSVSPIRAQQEDGVDRTGLRVARFGERKE